MPEWLLIVLFVLGPLTPPVIGLWLLYRRKANKAAIVFYNARIAGSYLSISRRALGALICWGFIFYWLDYISPVSLLILSPFTIIVGVCLIYLTRKSTQSQVNLSGHSTQLLSSLQTMQSEIGRVRTHVEHLAAEIQVRQNEISENEKVKTSLLNEIDSKLKEVKEWTSLTDKQREMMIDATRTAISRRSSVGIAFVILGSVALNLVANVIWALMGQPGKERLIQLFVSFRDMFS